MQQPRFLPMTRAEMTRLGWETIDILLVTGDAYVDHSSFGAALIGRSLVAQGFRVGIISQPDWKNPEAIKALGRPRLYAGVTAGAMDSMVANYTANKKLRRDDAYTPGGAYGFRPNRASIVYTNLVRHAFPGLPVVLGGIEASLRRLAHYDYWEDKLRRSLLLDTKADILVYGMGEKPAAEIAKRLAKNESLEGIPQTALVLSTLPDDLSYVELPSFEDITKHKHLLAKAAIIAEQTHVGAYCNTPLVQAHGNRWVVVYAPNPPLTTKEMDALYALPFTRQAHPSYTEKVPALEPVRSSIVTHRGCFGGCSFCALGAHQGKLIQSRSSAAIVSEVRTLTHSKDFHGTISDVGGPSANMYQLTCQRAQGPCDRASCLFPALCPHLKTSHHAQVDLLKTIQAIPGVKHVFVASGIRFDLALQDPTYVRELIKGRHVSGMLKIAPEHVDPKVLKLMRKPESRTCEAFVVQYQNEARKQGLPAYITAYFIASFPGSSQESMQAVQAFAGKLGLRVEQMQDFIPLPMTLAGIMYYTGQNPWTQEPLTIAKTAGQRSSQRKTLLGTAKNFRDKKR